MIDDAATLAYVARHFIDEPALARLCGASDDELAGLLAAKAAPGVVYARSDDGTWWSALGAGEGAFPAEPPTNGSRWFTPAAAYWVRRALLLLRQGMTPQQAARSNQAHFTGQFAATLRQEPLSRCAFPDAFDGDSMRDDVSSIAEREWADWIDGSYAVCLRSFTGATCVQKEALAASLKRDEAVSASPEARLATLDQLERLNALMLPFAPFQRPGGTPGKAVDRVLEILELGVEQPYR